MPSHRDYKFGKQLGRGSFGVVHKVERKSDGGIFVCKEIPLRGMKPKAREEANQEVWLLRKISSGSVFIVQYIESFLERESLHIIMEFCENGDLSSYLKPPLRLPPLVLPSGAGPPEPCKAGQLGQCLEEATVWKFAIQIGLGLHWLHTNRILHRDIKSLNVFLSAQHDARLGDLGVARVLSAECNFANTLVGTPYYLSPEMCNSQPYNEKSDVWAYGNVLYEMCTFRHPFEARNQLALLAKITRGRYRPISDGYSSEMKGLVDDCLMQDMVRRPTVNLILLSEPVRAWAVRLGIELPADAEANQPQGRAASKRRWARLRTQVSHLHDEAVKDLDAPTRLAWDSLYRLLRAKMAAELTAEDHREVERYIFEELPPEHTDLISKVCKILPLQQECDRCQEMLDN